MTTTVDRKALNELLKRSAEAVKAMTDEQREAMWQAQQDNYS